jgi:hypothetical protein
MWAGGDSASRQKPERSALLRCEGTWTRADSTSDPNNPTIEVDPPSNLPVVTDPIFTPPTTCWHPITLADPGSQTTVLHDGPVSLPVTAVDTSPGQSLAYRAVGLPNGLSIGAGSGLITGTPSVRQRASVTVTASDSYNSVSVRFGWIVRPARRTRPRGPA